MGGGMKEMKKWTVNTGLALLGAGFLLVGAAAQGETLPEAVGEVISTNPQVRAQAYNRLARDQEVRQAMGGYYPTLDFVAGAGSEDFQEPVDQELDPVEMRLSLRWNLFAGFSTMNEIDRQNARVRSSAYRLQGISENIALETARVYLEVLRREELKAIAEENLLTHLRISDQINLRSQSGVGSQADSEQVAGRVSLAQSNVVVTETNLLDAKTNYLAVVGHIPGDLVKPQSPESLLPASLYEAESMAIAGHPTLKSAEADLEARREQNAVAESPYWPRVDFEVDQNWEEDVDGVEGDQESTLAMVRLRYNLFNGFADEGRRVETKHLIEEAREIRNNTHRQVVESVRLSWMAYQSVLDRIQYLKEHVASSTATSQSYTKQFDLGKRTLLDVLDTEAEVIEARRDLINATYDGLFAQYRILGGLGLLVEALDQQWPEESTVKSSNSGDEAETEAES